MGKHRRHSRSSSRDHKSKKTKRSRSRDGGKYKRRDSRSPSYDSWDEGDRKKHHREERKKSPKGSSRKTELTREEMIKLEQAKRKQHHGNKDYYYQDRKRSSSDESSRRKRNPSKEKQPEIKQAVAPITAVAAADVNEDDFAKMFGFSEFSTTKGMDHQDDAQEAVYKQFIRKRDFRQFMNKKAGVRTGPLQNSGSMVPGGGAGANPFM